MKRLRKANEKVDEIGLRVTLIIVLMALVGLVLSLAGVPFPW